jgi:hypothetical protein
MVELIPNQPSSVRSTTAKGMNALEMLKHVAKRIRHAYWWYSTEGRETTRSPWAVARRNESCPYPSRENLNNATRNMNSNAESLRSLAGRIEVRLDEGCDEQVSGALRGDGGEFQLHL